MELLKFDEQSVMGLSGLSEAGMDFWIVNGHSNHIPSNVQVAVRGNGFALPLDATENFYSLAHLLEGQKLPEKVLEISMSEINPVLTTFGVQLPNGYQTAFGSHQLLGSITLIHPTRFFRYTSSSTDSRFSVDTLTQDTYLTSINDQQLANSGFGAVGRYALPLPIPASYKHDYTLPAGTVLLVGTISPQFGQAGGGVEVKTTNSVTGVRYNGTTNLTDF